MRHEHTVHLRWADQDANAHVNNVTYAAYLQEARAHMLSAGAAEAGGSALLGTLVVVRMRVDYLRPLLYRATPVTALTWLSSIRASTVTVECEIRDGEVAYCRGSTTLAPFDFGSGRPRRISPHERAALEPYLE